MQLKQRIPILIALLLTLVACNNNKVTNTSGEARLEPTDNPETPYILEGNYTPEIGVTYKVIVGGDTCFVLIDSIDDNQMHGYYYQVFDSSNCVERKEFSKDVKWKKQRQEAIVYVYQDPPYEAIHDPRFLHEYCSVVERDNVEYGQALGFWCSRTGTENDSYAEIIANGLKNSIKRTTQSLTFDIYLPDDNRTTHPLLLLLHGGGFYVGDKHDELLNLMCRHFASRGYVAVSANYRLGFLPTKGEIARTGYMALQDAHAAMRFLVDNAQEYRIDTNLIFVGGCSAGSITALNLAFMRDKDRPKEVTNSSRHNLGIISSSGNSSHATFHIKALANMWGAVTNLNILTNSKTDIISFHGDADLVVPYDNGYPFSDISKILGKRMFDKMYGSLQIDQKARELGLKSELHTFNGEGHSLHHNSDGSWNQRNYNFIVDKITDFFYKEIIVNPARIEDDRNDTRHYLVTPDNVSDVCWHVEGGYIMKIDSNEIWVVWRDDAEKQSLNATGYYSNGVGFETELKIAK